MTHLREDDLVLHHYGEDGGAARAHLAECPTCRAAMDRLRRTLALVPVPHVPERDPDYGAQVWRRLRPLLPERPGPSWTEWLRPHRLAWAGAAGAMIVASFAAGRVWQEYRRPPAAAAGPEAVRERVLLVMLGPHLERSQLVLLEVMNADPGGPLDVADEREQARDLLGANRLYRQAALGIDPALGAVLDRMEQVLVEIASGPAVLDPSRLAEIQERIDSQGLLLSIRILGSKVDERRRWSTPSFAPDAT